RNETDIFIGTGNLGASKLSAASYLLQPNATGNGASGKYLCLFTKDNAEGRRHCTPPNGDKTLSWDFNDQVRSVRSYPNWRCVDLTLWQHGNQIGEHITFAADVNLELFPFVQTSPLLATTWASITSSYRYDENSGPFTDPLCWGSGGTN
ncbi:MAG: hypothetical protein AAGF23_27340, partial [Acidobacteriota bacterium]